MFPGLPTRLENEVVNLYKNTILKNPDAELTFDIEVKVILSLYYLSSNNMKGFSKKKVQCIYRRRCVCKSLQQYRRLVDYKEGLGRTRSSMPKETF